MMTPEAPKIRDLTGGRIRLPIDLITSPVVDLLIAAWAREMDHEEQATYEVGVEWFDELAKRVPDDLAAEMGELGGAWGTTWFGVMGLVAGAPEPDDPDSFFDWLADLDPTELRLALISGKHGGPPTRSTAGRRAGTPPRWRKRWPSTSARRNSPMRSGA